MPCFGIWDICPGCWRRKDKGVGGVVIWVVSSMLSKLMMLGMLGMLGVLGMLGMFGTPEAPGMLEMSESGTLEMAACLERMLLLLDSKEWIPAVVYRVPNCCYHYQKGGGGDGDGGNSVGDAGIAGRYRNPEARNRPKVAVGLRRNRS